MEQKFNSFSHLSDLDLLQNFCMQEGEIVDYQKGDLMEREGEPSNWFGFVSLGCFRYLTKGISDGREHITWFSFKGEFVGDYPCCLNGRPAQTTIEAMTNSRIHRIKGELLTEWFCRNPQTMQLRNQISEHLLFQARERYIDFHRGTPLDRYNLLLHRCPGIVEHLSLKDIASFLSISPQQLSRIRRNITFRNDF